MLQDLVRQVLATMMTVSIGDNAEEIITATSEKDSSAPATSSHVMP